MWVIASIFWLVSTVFAAQERRGGLVFIWKTNQQSLADIDRRELPDTTLDSRYFQYHHFHQYYTAYHDLTDLPSFVDTHASNGENERCHVVYLSSSDPNSGNNLSLASVFESISLSKYVLVLPAVFQSNAKGFGFQNWTMSRALSHSLSDYSNAVKKVTLLELEAVLSAPAFESKPSVVEIALGTEDEETLRRQLLPSQISGHNMQRATAANREVKDGEVLQALGQSVISTSRCVMWVATLESIFQSPVKSARYELQKDHSPDVLSRESTKSTPVQFHGRLLKQTRSPTSAPIPSSNDNNTSRGYPLIGLDFSVYHNNQYLYITPEIITGLITALCLFFVLANGLSFMHDIQGAASFSDEKQVPPIGKEA